MDAKYRKYLWISIGLSLAVLLAVVIFTFDENTISALQNLDYKYILLAFALHITALFFWGLRILVLSKSLGYKVPFSHCINMAAAGQLLAAITPSSIGGEPVRIHELYKADIPLAESTAIVLVERILEAVLLVIGVIIGMVMFSIMFGERGIPHQIMILAWCGIVFFAFLLVILILMMRKHEFIKKIGLKITGFITKKFSEERQNKINNAVSDGIDNFYAAIAHFSGKAKLGLFTAMFLSLCFWTCEYLIASVIMVGLGYNANILLSIIFQLIIAIILMIPLTPGSAGFAEVCYFGFYSIILPSSVIGIFIVLQRLIMYYSNLVIGFIASFIIVKREASSKKVIEDEKI
ncbi:MAG TPA: flippase-like domain-containing protein [Methanocorpusculum sp.]|nr:flippase-like domain-containing protein [Methanocorpusculum sp.]